MCTGLRVKCSIFLSDFNETSTVPTEFRNTQISNFMKIRPVGSDSSMRTEGRKDRHEVNSRFSQVCDRAKMGEGNANIMRI